MSSPATLRATTRVSLTLLVLACLASSCALVERISGASELTTEQLAAATYHLGPLGDVTLVAGAGTLADGSAVRLAQPVALGDLDGSGDEDAAVVLLHDRPDQVVDAYLVPVLGRGGEPAPLAPVALGPDVSLQELAIAERQARLLVLDRTEGTALDVVNERRRMSVEVQGDQPVVVGDQRRGFAELPVTEDLPAQPIALAPGTTAGAVDGVVSTGQSATYTVPVQRGQRVVAQLQGPTGVFMALSLGGETLVPPAEGAVALEEKAPEAGNAVLRVRNAGVAPANFRLDVDVPTLPPEPPVIPSEAGVIYLTFDDGPHPTYTPQVLDVLAKHGAKATFFVLGKQAAAHPDLVQRIVAEGHTVANHTWDHPSLKGAGQARWDQQVARTQDELGRNATPCLRPPYGEIDAAGRQRATEEGLAVVMWTADTFDWQRPGAGTIASRIVNGAKDGAIILMHDAGGPREQTIAGLDQALTQLAAQGWRYKPVCTR